MMVVKAKHASHLATAKAIEQYVSSKENKDEAKRATRILETAVGVALGVADQTYPGKNGSHASEPLSKDDRHRFRLMAEHRTLWWPVLDEKVCRRAGG